MNNAIIYDIESAIQVENPIIPTTLKYSPFIPDISVSESSERNNASRLVNLNRIINDIIINQTRLYVKIDTMNEKIEKIEKAFYKTIKFRLWDCCIAVVLWIIIYIKVFVGF